MNSMDIAVGAALLAIGGLGQISAWQIRKLLGSIHVSVDGNLSEVKKDLKLTSEALASSREELGAARKDISFLKEQIVVAGVSPSAQKRAAKLTKKRSSGAKRELE